MHSVVTRVPKYLRTHLLKTKCLDWSSLLSEYADLTSLQCRPSSFTISLASHFSDIS